MTKTLTAILALLITINTYGQQTSLVDGDFHEIKVEGTEMARLPYVMDVLRQTPKLTFGPSDEITVIGRGTPAIYVNNRKVTELTELSHIAASKVSSIMVISQPGAEYGKDVQAVIVIRLIEESNDGLNINEVLRFDMTHKLSTNNELDISWKKKALTLGAFLAINEEKRTFDKETFKYRYQYQQLIDKETSFQHPDIYKLRLTGSINASYAFDASNNLSLRYSMMNLTQDRTFVPENKETNRQPDERHDIDVEYKGKIGAWDIVLGNNTFFDNIHQTIYKPLTTSYYLRDEFDTRTYIKANAPLWKGVFVVGAEHEYDYMEVDKHDDNPNYIEIENRYLGTHATHPDNTLALFASTSQKFGNWTLEGGVRYEHRRSVYKPCKDDGLMAFIEDARAYIMSDPERFYLGARLLKDGQLTTRRDFLYPTLRVSTKLGKSTFALTHSQSSVRPYLGLTRLNTADTHILEEKILWTERVSTTSLGWKYDWVDLTAAYTIYTDPICSTFDGATMYNAPDYDAFDFNAMLSPHVGIWTPVLNINTHKQWFDMPLANGKKKLHKLLCNVSLNNFVTLPQDWLVTIGANWHSKGAERNYYYYRTNLSINASIQKELPRHGLTFVLSATNMLRHSYSDVTRYTQAFYHISEGAREQEVRMVSLAVKWKL